MSNPDELRELWKSQPSLAETKGEDVMEVVQKKIQRFDRRMAMRNLRESLASAVVALVFGWQAWHTHNWLTRTGDLVVAAGSVWIIYYLLRYGRTSAGVDLSQSVMECTRALIRRYDDQIRLLKNVKYWYLLPMYAGLVIGSAGQFAQQTKADGVNWRIYAAAAFYTAVFALFWWVNEVYWVGRLRDQRARLLSSMGSEA